MTIIVRGFRADKVCIQILGFHGRTWNGAAPFIRNISLHRARGDLPLTPTG